MQEVLLLKDFYDKCFVPMGKKDRETLEKSETAYETATHWLIALTWYEEKAKSGWRVSVHPVCQNKPFWFLAPYYETATLYSFDTALQMSRILEAHSKEDLITSRLFHKEIREVIGMRPKASL